MAQQLSTAIILQGLLLYTKILPCYTHFINHCFTNLESMRTVYLNITSENKDKNINTLRTGDADLRV